MGTYGESVLHSRRLVQFVVSSKIDRGIERDPQTNIACGEGEGLL